MKVMKIYGVSIQEEEEDSKEKDGEEVVGGGGDIFVDVELNVDAEVEKV